MNQSESITAGAIRQTIDDRADPVNRPAHYQTGGIETIEIIRAMLTDDEFRGYLKGNILKYRERAQFKGNAEQDYAKARWYMARLDDLRQ